MFWQLYAHLTLSIALDRSSLTHLRLADVSVWSLYVRLWLSFLPFRLPIETQFGLSFLPILSLWAHKKLSIASHRSFYAHLTLSIASCRSSNTHSRSSIVLHRSALLTSSSFVSARSSEAHLRLAKVSAPSSSI